MTALFTLRPAAEPDRQALELMLGMEGMDTFDSLEGVTVAVNETDEVVGFIRIAIGENGKAYVNPVVVFPTWRGYGVGSSLTDAALAQYGELRLVSRGASKPFYDKMGFQCCDWSLIVHGVSEDCDNCSWREECRPQPMRRML
ncbi:GNAT family N-acetyltransferase [Adlercreutzia sp. ZJ154]|uniref:GNAT family N-acetyltransferase n=1 Tax=Adlercreutzia sp. ZJ154 TaxID=2709790 RepID=UPI0013EB1054|nr:GNAT family N-acetyltransferase [Adlercreutzia sp. ZJ154]